MAPAWLAGSRNNVHRLVENPYLARLGANRLAIERDFALLINIAGRIRDDVAADRDGTRGDQLL